MIVLGVEKVEKKLGVELPREMFGIRNARLTLYDRRRGINRFVVEPRIERVEVEWRPPVLFIVVKLRLGRYMLRVPVLAFDLLPE